MLVDCSCNVVGPAGAIASAIAVIEANGQALDGALLDINLRGDMVYPVADALLHRSVPFVFVAGYARNQIDSRYAAIRALGKPFPSAAIDGVVRSFEDWRLAKLSVEGTTLPH